MRHPPRSPWSRRMSLVKIVAGLGILIASSHFLVWGSVDFAKFLGVSDLVIGLTIVAAGTSLPELASAIASARRGEHEFVLGNIVGSNLFNTLAVVGVAVGVCGLHGVHDLAGNWMSGGRVEERCDFWYNVNSHFT